MPVKKNQGAEFAVKVFEKIAEHQPVGVTERSNIMGNTKSSLQRALVTLAECNWIRTGGEPAGSAGVLLDPSRQRRKISKYDMAYRNVAAWTLLAIGQIAAEAAIGARRLAEFSKVGGDVRWRGPGISI